MKTKDSFVFRKDWYEALQGLDDNVRLESYDAVMRYVFFGEVVETSPLANVAMRFILPQVQRDIDKYNQICESRKVIGSKGGTAKASKSKQEVPNGSKSKQEVASVADNDSGNDSDSDIKESNDSMVIDELNKKIELLEKEKEELEKEIRLPIGDNGKKAVEEKKPRGKSSSTLSGRAKETFVEYYDNLSISDEPYYWTGKDAGQIKQLLDKIKYSRKSRGLDIDDDSVIFALNAFLGSISDPWILQHLEPAIINSKYNEIVASAKKTSETQQFPPNPKHGDTIGYDWYYDGRELHRWIKDRETDDKGRIFSVQLKKWLI